MTTLLLLLACGSGSPGTATSTTTPPNAIEEASDHMDPSAALEMISHIASQRPFEAEAIARLAGMPLRQKASSNAWFTVYSTDQAGSAFASLEVREPTQQSLDKGKGGLVLVGLSGDCLLAADVGDRFGAAKPGPPAPPSPRAPRSAPATVTHPQPWGEVRLGYDRDSGCLVQVVLDATG